MDYFEQLQTSQWKAKREEIIHRDLGLCTQCLTSKNLNVHHKYYIEGRKAWEYPGGALITLCGTCHERLHKDSRVPVIKSCGLDEALERLVSVAKGYRDWKFNLSSDGKEAE